MNFKAKAGSNPRPIGQLSVRANLHVNLHLLIHVKDSPGSYF